MSSVRCQVVSPVRPSDFISLGDALFLCMDEDFPPFSVGNGVVSAPCFPGPSKG